MIPVAPGTSHVVPVLIGGNDAAVAVADAMQADGFDVRVAWQNHGWIKATGNSFAAPHIAAYAARIRTPLLIQHSEKDIRTTIGQAEALFTVLRSKKRPVRLLRVPEETHELTRSGSPTHRVQRFELVLDASSLADGPTEIPAPAAGVLRLVIGQRLLTDRIGELPAAAFLSTGPARSASRPGPTSCGSRAPGSFARSSAGSCSMACLV